MYESTFGFSPPTSGTFLSRVASDFASVVYTEVASSYIFEKSF